MSSTALANTRTPQLHTNATATLPALRFGNWLSRSSEKRMKGAFHYLRLRKIFNFILTTKKESAKVQVHQNGDIHYNNRIELRVWVACVDVSVGSNLQFLKWKVSHHLPNPNILCIVTEERTNTGNSLRECQVRGDGHTCDC